MLYLKESSLFIHFYFVILIIKFFIFFIILYLKANYFSYEKKKTITDFIMKFACKFNQFILFFQN